MKETKPAIKNQENEKPLANLQLLFQNLNEEEEIFDQFIIELPHHVWDCFQKLEEASGHKNVKDIEFAAHALRGICLNFEMYKVNAITLEIEKITSADSLTDLPLLLTSLKIELIKALSYIMEQKSLIIGTI